MIILKNVSKFYYNKGIIASGFSKVNLELKLGEFVAITGESGSGKSTLLNVISGLDSYEEGEMYIAGQETSHYSERDFEEYRRKYISNIFQNFNLVNSYTVYQNIELVLLLNGNKKHEIKDKITSLMKQVGLYKYRNTKVSKLSGGQKQRVAIARALAKETPIIIADEPTGNLDSKSAKEIIKLLHDLSKDKLVIVVTHNYEQVEPYVTRKIKMHDGKILEDKVIKKSENLEEVTSPSNPKPINFLGKLRLGIRNAFNIIPKFILVFFVYLFITSAVITEYAFFKEQEYTAGKSGYNNYFMDTTDTRIVIKKQDGTAFTEEEYQTLSTLDHVGSLVKNDLLLDSNINLTNNNDFYFNATIHDIADFKGKVNLGNLPQTENEIIIVGSKDDYYLSNLANEIIGKEVYIEDMYGGSNKEQKLKIVGIKYQELDNYYGLGEVYANSAILENLRFSINKQYSEVKTLFQNEYHTSYTYDMNYQVIKNSNVPAGKAMISSDLNFSCKNDSCINQPLTIEVDNLYYKDTLNLTVSNTYNKKNMESLLKITDFDSYNGAIFINDADYDNLYHKGNYQSSIFVDNVSNLDGVVSSLEELGYTTLKIKDTLVTSGVLEVMKILRTIVTAALVITLFFISYFVIRIILKSRNTYFGTLRILGATKKQSKQLLIIELLTVSNLAYFLFLFLLYATHLKFIEVGFFRTILQYLKLSDYILLYIIITTMSYFISLRFSKKIFKNSAMVTMREEV